LVRMKGRDGRREVRVGEGRGRGRSGRSGRSGRVTVVDHGGRWSRSGLVDIAKVGRVGVGIDGGTYNDGGGARSGSRKRRKERRKERSAKDL
jgi:hypothetical protein